MMVYPSIYDEMCCIAALESAAAGCAIVATDRAALSERVRDGISGYLVPGTPGTEEHDDLYVEHVVDLLQDSEKRSKMGRAGREMVQQYDHAALAKQWIAKFEEMRQ